MSSALPSLHILSLLFLLVGFASEAQQLVSPADQDEIAKIATSKVPHGFFQGQPLNTAVRRPIFVLGNVVDQKDLQQRLNQEEILVANLYHDGEFYIAQIPIKSIESAFLLSAPFSPVASHTMLRFSFAEGKKITLLGRLHPINSQIEVLPQPLEISDVVLSIDGTEAKSGPAWNMLDAVRGRYTIAYRLVSIKERFKWFIMNGTPIQQTKLNLSPAEVLKTFQLALFKSHTSGFSKSYSLLKANCTNLIIELVKEANPPLKRLQLSEPRWSAKIRVLIDKFTTFAEVFTQFTQWKLALLGWIESKQVDLQRDPEFQEELKSVLKDYEQSISERTDYSLDEKEDLIRKLGLRRPELLENPKFFKEALHDYSDLLKAERKWFLKRKACLETLHSP